MVLEVATIRVVPGQEDAFLTAYRGVRHLVTSTQGFRSIRMSRGVESPSTFVMLIEWTSTRAHLQNFRGDEERFTAWRAAIGPHFAQEPHVEHFEYVI